MMERFSVQDALRSRLGSAVADDPGFAEGAVRLLRSWFPERESLASLSLRMEDYLFNVLYELLGPGMMLHLGGGLSRRFQMSELPAAADEAMFPLFASLRPTQEHYALLHDYWMGSGSGSAMRALYLFFQKYLPPAESEMIERIVRENVPVPMQELWFRRG